MELVFNNITYMNRRENNMKKSEIFYLDDEDNIVGKDEATHSIIREMDDDGNLVSESFSFDKDFVKKRIKSYDEYTDEEKEFFASFVDKDGNHFGKDRLRKQQKPAVKRLKMLEDVATFLP